MWVNLTRHKDGRCKPITTIKDIVRQVSSNDIGEQDAPGKRLLDDSIELYDGEETCKPPKYPKIQSILDEIINGSSPERLPSQPIPQNVSVLQKKKLLR